MSYVTGSHSLKVGFTDTWAQHAQHVETEHVGYMLLPLQQRRPEPVHACTRGPTRGTGRRSRARSASSSQDRWTIDRLTLNAGLRYDQFIGGYPEQTSARRCSSRPATITFPAVTGNNLQGRHAARRRRLRPVRQRQDGAQGEPGQVRAGDHARSATRPASRTQTTRIVERLDVPGRRSARGNFSPGLRPAEPGSPTASAAPCPSSTSAR